MDGLLLRTLLETRNLESGSLPLQAQRAVVQRPVVQRAECHPLGTTSSPLCECHWMCAAASPSRRSRKRMSCSHTAQRSS